MTTVIALPRRWWQTYADWRVIVLLAVFLAFLSLVVLPTATALLVRQRSTAPSLQAWITSADEQTLLPMYQMETGHVIELPLGEYIADVLAAELPPDAPPAALQAAAIAARTYAVRALSNRTAASFATAHGAAVTDSSQLDLPLETEAAQEARFGGQANWAQSRYQAAILATDGEILTYQDKPILAFTFALSPGQTRSAAEVFGRSIPYLVAVPCPDDAATSAQPIRWFTPTALSTALKVHITAANLTAFQVAERDGAGFAKVVRGPGNAQWSGDGFARALGLSSADVQFRVQGGRLGVIASGIGRDIGLSIHEAISLASQGQSATQILERFYPGTALRPDAPFLPPTTS